MRQTTQTIFGSQEKLRLIAGDHFIAMPINIKKSDWTAVLTANDGKIPAGTLITATGTPVTTTVTTSDVYGIVYQTLDFNNAIADDNSVISLIGSVLVHGAVYTSKVKLDATNGAIEKAALKQIIFGA